MSRQRKNYGKGHCLLCGEEFPLNCSDNIPEHDRTKNGETALCRGSDQAPREIRELARAAIAVDEALKNRRSA